MGGRRSLTFRLESENEAVLKEIKEAIGSGLIRVSDSAGVNASLAIIHMLHAIGVIEMTPEYLGDLGRRYGAFQSQKTLSLPIELEDKKTDTLTLPSQLRIEDALGKAVRAIAAKNRRSVQGQILQWITHGVEKEAANIRQNALGPVRERKA